MESLKNALATSLMVSIPVSVLGCDGITYELGDLSPEDTIVTVKWRLSELSHNDILTSSLYLTEDTRGETTRDFELKNTEQIHEVRSYLEPATTKVRCAVLVHQTPLWMRFPSEIGNGGPPWTQMDTELMAPPGSIIEKRFKIGRTHHGQYIWYRGRVQSFSSISNKHTFNFDDGDVKTYHVGGSNLGSFKYQILQLPPQWDVEDSNIGEDELPDITESAELTAEQQQMLEESRPKKGACVRIWRDQALEWTSGLVLQATLDEDGAVKHHVRLLTHADGEELVKEELVDFQEEQRWFTWRPGLALHVEAQRRASIIRDQEETLKCRTKVLELLDPEQGMLQSDGIHDAI
jgi:hypothetical protein